MDKYHPSSELSPPSDSQSPGGEVQQHEQIYPEGGQSDWELFTSMPPPANLPMPVRAQYPRQLLYGESDHRAPAYEHDEYPSGSDQDLPGPHATGLPMPEHDEAWQTPRYHGYEYTYYPNEPSWDPSLHDANSEPSPSFTSSAAAPLSFQPPLYPPDHLPSSSASPAEPGAQPATQNTTTRRNPPKYCDPCRKGHYKCDSDGPGSAPCTRCRNHKGHRECTHNGPSREEQAARRNSRMKLNQRRRQEAEGNGVAAPPPRRRCDQCHARRKACDNGAPLCGGCARRGLPCTYDRPVMKKGPYVERPGGEEARGGQTIV